LRKTLVIGVFAAVAEARAVLEQLASSPLDLHDVTVLHRDGATQRDLRRAAGIPDDRSALVAALAGAVVGAAAGVLATSSVPALGPALNAAVGGVLGAAAAVAAFVWLTPLKIPAEHRAALAAAVEGGDVLLVVRAEGLPTASAIGDLFRAYGARDLGLAPPPPAPEAGGPRLYDAAGEKAPAGGDQMFLPPHRRSEGGQ
jgi:hypothetical protein